MYEVQWHGCGCDVSGLCHHWRLSKKGKVSSGGKDTLWREVHLMLPNRDTVYHLLVHGEVTMATTQNASQRTVSTDAEVGGMHSGQAVGAVVWCSRSRMQYNATNFQPKTFVVACVHPHPLASLARPREIRRRVTSTTTVPIGAERRHRREIAKNVIPP